MHSSVLLLFVTINIVTGAPADGETQYAPNVAVGASGVSASWGGYSAAAGLGGEVGNGKRGGLFAAAEAPHGRAAAGLGGSVEKTAQGSLYAGAEFPQSNVATADVGGYIEDSIRGGADVAVPQHKAATAEVDGAVGGIVKGGYDTTAHTGSSAGAGLGGGIYVTKGVYATKVVQTQPSLFDRIFNIPISVLQSVNTHLNNRDYTKRVYVQGGAAVGGGHGVTGGVHDAGSQTPVVAPAEVSGSALANGAVQSGGGAEVATYETKPELKSSVAAGGAAGAVVVHKPRPNYDQIFNIPISVLKSVNTHLNNADYTKRVYVQGGAAVGGGHEVTGGVHDAGSQAPAVVPAAGSAEVSGSALAYGAVQSGGGAEVATYETKPELKSSVAAGSAAEGAGAVVVRKRLPNYDQIFNIPISALKSVNQLLNG